jgi:ElaB/YqjD/DUF883 family membrane-anchored ribosome-binding protein
MRDYAYQFGEATNRHWVTLLAADRVNRVESKPWMTVGALALGAFVVGALLRRR